MKKLFGILTLAAFAMATTLSAEEGKCCEKNKPAQGEKGTCPAGGNKKGCCPKDGAGEKTCPAKDKTPPPPAK